MRAVILIGLLALGACAPKPQIVAEKLDRIDPKFDTEECRQMRQKALDYDDKVGGRMAIGLASGLLLGPFGLPIAAAADANQNEIRRSWSRELWLACSSQPLPKNLLTTGEKPADLTPEQEAHRRAIEERLKQQHLGESR
ncbi:hypothetical protein HDIA_1964 [Hartmannibacter diazotrophicus]|uniref:Lipoprotein n=1 Tax=Hartmannibacter diazotrophicus TaxID=1482074 RepID=A0A2C9D7J0_9HYPH|nr:hypothetical protein [Hartmannibacter diazotrophicus]SON55505.1 hypothetical protein HDIA_1964 [Hartmannibacter diazotrophicus]